MTINGLNDTQAFLEDRIRNMNLLIHYPNIKVYQEEVKWHPLPVIKLGSEIIDSQKLLDQVKYVNGLLDAYNDYDKKLLDVLAAITMIGKRVVKKSRKPFQCGSTVVTVRNVIHHPYRPGWHLAYNFADDDSCISVDQVREFHGN